MTTGNSAWAARRGAGVLLPVFSLPSRFGIGDMGGAAYEFADELARAGLRFWQILPLNPTSAEAGESPYFSSSALAGNPMLISLDALAAEGLLEADELAAFPDDLNPEAIDFARVRPLKMAALGKAARRFLAREQDEAGRAQKPARGGGLSAQGPDEAGRARRPMPDGGLPARGQDEARGLDEGFARFAAEHAAWLRDFALFTALADEHGAAWGDWPAAYRDREPAALRQFSAARADAIREIEALQYFFHRQWHALKAHCNRRGLLIVGDMPIYLSYASADVWANPGFFKLGDNRKPRAVSGVPPDYFSATGQLWNNPVYDWDALSANGYAWWVARMGGLFALYDIVRIDHFRGLVQFWEVPAGAPNAINGRWMDGPGNELFDALLAAYPDFPVLVEDLGHITPDVVAVKERYGLPGMRVLHFAFDDDGRDNPHRFENHPAAAVAYLGTHDNETTEGWLQAAGGDVRRRVAKCLGDVASAGSEGVAGGNGSGASGVASGDGVAGDGVAGAGGDGAAGAVGAGAEENISTEALMKLALASNANIAILTAQDLLRLPARARINNPATNTGNWQWRMTDEEYQRLPFKWLAEQAAAAGRRWER